MEETSDWCDLPPGKLAHEQGCCHVVQACSSAEGTCTSRTRTTVQAKHSAAVLAEINMQVGAGMTPDGYAIALLASVCRCSSVPGLHVVVPWARQLCKPCMQELEPEPQSWCPGT